MLTWAVQTNLINQRDLQSLKAACEKTGQNFLDFQAIPFSDELPDVPNQGPTVFYGATRCMAQVHSSRRWNPGVFFDEAFFNFNCWSQQLPTLNGGAQVTTLEGLASQNHAAERLFFVRPCDDSKAFAGEVMAFGDIQQWCRQLSAEACEVSPSCPIVAAEPVGIAKEWRLFVVEGKVASGSQYRVNHRLEVDPLVPAEVCDFVERLADRWQPAPVFVMDVALSGGDLYVIEVNCFNSAGFYASDVERIVARVSACVAG